MKTKEYNIYKNMLEACETATVNEEMAFDCTDEQNEMLLFLAIELAKMELDNPIEPGIPGYNDYEDLKFFYDIWPKDKPNCAIKKRFMISAYRLCKACPENIFEWQQEEKPIIEISLEDMKEQEYAETEQEDIDTNTYIPAVYYSNETLNEKNKKVFGVIPFEDEEEKEEKPHTLFKRNKRRNKR